MAATQGSGGKDGPLFHGFRFFVSFTSAPLPGATDEVASPGAKVEPRNATTSLVYGGFSEISGLEATMEPVAINEGGLNWGQHQRVGRTTFSTVILRRGITATRHLWDWFSHVNREGGYKHRMDVEIRLRGHTGRAEIAWLLKRAMPVKLKLADLNAAGQELAIEELHLAHEGLTERLVAGEQEQQQQDASPGASA